MGHKLEFDDIKKGDAVWIRSGTGQTAVVAGEPVKEHDGMRVVFRHNGESGRFIRIPDPSPHQGVV